MIVSSSAEDSEDEDAVVGAGAVCASMRPVPRGMADSNANKRREGVFFINDLVWLGFFLYRRLTRPPEEAYESAESRLSSRRLLPRNSGDPAMNRLLR